MDRSTSTTEHHLQPVETYTSAEHDQLDAILADVRQMVLDGELERAEYNFRDYLESAARVLRAEETLVFPRFEQNSDSSTVVARLRREHLLWREATDIMRTALERGDTARFLLGYELTVDLMPEHNRFEEEAVYPVLDHLLGDDERAAFAERLRLI